MHSHKDKFFKIFMYVQRNHVPDALTDTITNANKNNIVGTNVKSFEILEFKV